MCVYEYEVYLNYLKRSKIDKLAVAETEEEFLTF